MAWRGFAQRFAGLHAADAALGSWRDSLVATAPLTATATALKVRGAVAQERVSRQTSDNYGNAGELENTWRASTGSYYE
jgi:hypothetical protein